jgi:hypothetical protein
MYFLKNLIGLSLVETGNRNQGIHDTAYRDIIEHDINPLRLA